MEEQYGNQFSEQLLLDALGLVARALHNGRAVIRCRSGSFCPSLRRGFHLSRRTFGELVPSVAYCSGDLEVERIENYKGELYEFAYPLADGSGELVVATTRPETMLGDSGVAVHPEDERYKNLIGKSLKHPILGYEIPIVGDAILVDPEFGTGAVKVTPAHDFNDFETGKRHTLQLFNIFDINAHVLETPDVKDPILSQIDMDSWAEFAGLERYEARKKVKESSNRLAS